MNVFKKSIALLVAAVVVVTMCGKDVAYAAMYSDSGTEQFDGKTVSFSLTVDYEKTTAYTTYTQGAGTISTGLTCVMYRTSVPIAQYDTTKSNYSDSVSTPNSVSATVNAATGYAMKSAYSIHTYSIVLTSHTNGNGYRELYYNWD